MADIVIKLKGGTGNQLFQVAAVASFGEIYGKPCRFSIENISKNKYKRKLEISSLLKELGIIENLKKGKSNTIFLDQYDIDHPIYFSKSSPLFKLDHEIFLEGYFTNYRIHNKNVFKKIKSHLKGLKIAQNFKNLNYVAIHLRELHGSGKTQINNSIDNLNIDYYTKSLNEIFQDEYHLEIKHAIVFSDMWKDTRSSKLIPKIKDLLKNNGIQYIDGDNYINSSLEIINVFSYAKYCIISNSTLSWWGGIFK